MTLEIGDWVFYDDAIVKIDKYDNVRLCSKGLMPIFIDSYVKKVYVYDTWYIGSKAQQLNLSHLTLAWEANIKDNKDAKDLFTEAVIWVLERENNAN